MTLKVFDLQCENSHLFEGWFRSHEDYSLQHSRGFLTCPICHSNNITKCLSVPNLSRVQNISKSNSNDISNNIRKTDSLNYEKQSYALQAAALSYIRKLVKQTENVGLDFFKEARRIHKGQALKRPIRGIATKEERKLLTDEGIETLSIPGFLDDSSIH